MTGLRHDLAYALRLLRRQPGFAIVVILTMALGIGATTALFSITYGVLMKPLPWPESDRLVRLTESRQGREGRIRGTISNGTFNAWHADPQTIEEIGGYRQAATTMMLTAGEATRLQTTAVTPSLFTVLKARPLRGRLFVEDDARNGGRFPSKDLVILSYGLWQEQFAGREDAIGSVLQIGGKPTTIVGVMPADFMFPDRNTRAWTPYAVPGVLVYDGGRPYQAMSIFSGIARLRSGATAAQAEAEGTARARSAPDPGLTAVALFGGKGPAEISAVPAIAFATAEVRPALLVLLTAVFLLLVSATANVASLHLARATTRRREIAIRAAIGAGLGRVTRQLVIESAITGLLGGAAGLALAVALHRALPSLLPADFPRVDSVTVDARVVAFATALSVIAAIVCGLLPARQAWRLGLNTPLSEDRSSPSGGGWRSPAVRTRFGIMAAQMAIACILLIGGALLARSFVALLNSDRGYDPRNVLTARLPLPAGFSVERRTQLLERLVARLRSVPGVVEAAYGNALPLVTAGGYRGFKLRPPSNPSVEIEVNSMQRVVSPGYFRALGLHLIAGRGLTDADTMASREVVVLNRSFATKYLGKESPVGAIVPNLGMCRGDNDRWEVVGIVEDMRQGSVTDAPVPEIFMPYAQVGCPQAISEPIVVVRTNDDPGRQAGTLRTFIREEAPTIAPDSIMSMEDRVMTTLAKPRLYAVVLAGFGAFALAIAGVGLFGVLSYSVAQRTREIGVRTALGAGPGHIMALVLRQVAIVSTIGIGAGILASLAATRWLTKLLYGVTAHDTLSFVVVPAVLIAAAAIACVLPARRAAHVDPLSALRA